MPEPTELHIAPAAECDVPEILRLIRGLAAYEKLSHEVIATEEALRGSLFGPRPAAETLLGRIGSEAVGFALYFTNYSTFLGRGGLYLEDLFVLPQWRGRGFGRRLFAAVAQVAVERNAGRMEWAVLDWNEPALRFYRRLGAQALDDWTVQRLTGEALRRAALTPP